MIFPKNEKIKTNLTNEVIKMAILTTNKKGTDSKEKRQ